MAEDSLAPDPNRAPTELRDPVNAQIGLLTGDYWLARCRMNDCKSFGLLPSPCCCGKSWMALVTRSLKLGADGRGTATGGGACNSTAAGGLLGELGAGTGGGI